jgi:hypothetical protein
MASSFSSATGVGVPTMTINSPVGGFLVKGVVIPMSVGFLSAASTPFAAAGAL